jgi:outer membrane lipoprotein-sorting protein
MFGRTSRKGFFATICVAAGMISLTQAAAPPATAPTSQAVDPKLWAEMSKVDAKAANIRDVSADFEQKKFTPLLKKPLVSTGQVIGKGSATLWITDKPEPTKMLVNAGEIRIDYPRQAVMEVYPIEGQLGALASSPLPRLDTLRRFFSFEKIPAQSLDPQANDEKYLALRMIPIDPALREHVQEVKVLLDRQNGFIVRAENIDADDERTVLTFTHVRVNTGVADDAMRLDVPPGTKVTHPLEGLGGNAPARPKASSGESR